MKAGWKPTQHPVLELPSDDELLDLVKANGEDAVRDFLLKREEKIRLEKSNPYVHGFEPPCWQRADAALEKVDELCVLGGNRASKSEWAAKRMVQLMKTVPNARIWCLHTTSMSSIQMQQPLIDKYIPLEWKALKKTKHCNINFGTKGGYAMNALLGPNGSMMTFLNFAQEKRVVEGGEITACWIDEAIDESALDWIETLRYRLVTRRGTEKGGGKMLVTFTPITGYSPVVNDYLAGAQITETEKSELLPGQNVKGVPVGHMPIEAKHPFKNSSVVWFHTKHNPYNPWKQMVKQLEGRPRSEIKIRAYGWADNTAGAMFPQFGRHNIVKAADIPKKGSNYLAIDPGQNKNWFFVWLRVDEEGRKFVYREWPDVEVGEWATSGGKDGKVGTAQKLDMVLGVDQIIELVNRLEEGEEIFERYIDPRFGASQIVGKEGGTSIIDLLNMAGMHVEPSAGIRIEQGVATINEWLSYNENEPITKLNEPNLYVSEECQNLIYCMNEWKNVEKDGPTKDPCDTLRYIAVMDPCYMDVSVSAVSAGGSY